MIHKIAINGRAVVEVDDYGIHPRPWEIDAIRDWLVQSPSGWALLASGQSMRIVRDPNTVAAIQQTVAGQAPAQGGIAHLNPAPNAAFPKMATLKTDPPREILLILAISLADNYFRWRKTWSELTLEEREFFIGMAGGEIDFDERLP